MSALLYLIPIAFGMSLFGLGAFLWAQRAGQFEDMDSPAWRILDDDENPPQPPGDS